MAEFIELRETEKFLVKADKGYMPFFSIGKTIEYEVWELVTTNHKLKCANTHLIYKLDELSETLIETPVEWLTTDDYIVVDEFSTDGIAELVLSCRSTGEYEYMYDLLDVQDSRYYTNGILSHNSTTSVAYILHEILFNDYFNVALLANKSSMAMELLSRLKLSYEKLPIWLQHGIVNWNKYSIELENNSKVLAASTSTSSVRGNSFSLIMIDEMAHIPGHVCEEFFNSVYPTISSGKTTKMIITSCVTKDTFMMTPNGIKNNSDFIKGKNARNYEIPEYQVLGHHGFNTGNIFVNNGKAKTRVIHCNHTIIESSQNHKFWACKDGVYGWFESKDLVKGDHIAVKYNTHTYGSNDKINNIFGNSVVTKDIAYLLGVIISVGNVVDNVLELICKKDFDDILDVFNINYVYENKKYLIYSEELLRVIKYYNITYQNIPGVFLEWSRSNIYSLIQAIYDALALDRHTDINPENVAITIKTYNKNFATLIHMLLMNAGIINFTVGNRNKGCKPNTGLMPQSYTVRIVTCNSIQYFEEIGFRLQYKQDWSLRYKVPKCQSKLRDYIPHVFTKFKNELDPIQLHAAFPMKNVWFITRFQHFSRRRLIGRIDKRLKRFQLPWMDKFIDENIHHTVIWSKIRQIDESENEVYDICLPEIENDPWCHSVTYNGCITHQTPRGYNLFYKFWQDAIRGHSGYHPEEIMWNDIPGRDEEFKRATIAATSLKQFQQEFESVDYNTLVTIEDENGVEQSFRIGDLYEKLKTAQELEQKQNDAIDITPASYIDALQDTVHTNPDKKSRKAKSKKICQH